MSYFKYLNEIKVEKIRKVGDFDFTYDDDGIYLIAYNGNDSKISLPEDTYLSPYLVIPGVLKNKNIEEIYIPDNAFVCVEALNLDTLKRIYTVNDIYAITAEAKEAYSNAKKTNKIEVYLVREKKEFVLEVALKCKEANDYSSHFIRRTFNISYHRAENIKQFLLKKNVFEKVIRCNKSNDEIKNIILDESYEMKI